MNDENGEPSPNDPDVFSRGSLMLTFSLVRKIDPQLALNVRNITGGVPLPKLSAQPDNKNADFFKVELDSYQVRAVVEAIVTFSQAGNLDLGMGVVARTLLEEWTALAAKMIKALPHDSE
ncbi:MAG: hypothetical protein HOM11_03145 [Methylococcales bacterium]|jgi:hypothetical protein|nr:hypothetical protein [Methylococcales bacterium]MBT7443969.1 hypothetical protein [Methylococcales bacterium]